MWLTRNDQTSDRVQLLICTASLEIPAICSFVTRLSIFGSFATTAFGWSVICAALFERLPKPCHAISHNILTIMRLSCLTICRCLCFVKLWYSRCKEQKQKHKKKDLFLSLTLSVYFCWLWPDCSPLAWTLTLQNHSSAPSQTALSGTLCCCQQQLPQ